MSTSRIQMVNSNFLSTRLDFDNVSPVVTYHDYTIKGVHLRMQIADASFWRDIMDDNDLKRGIAKKFAEEMVIRNLCKFSVNVTTNTIVADAFIVPDDQVKILRQLGVVG